MLLAESLKSLTRGGEVRCLLARVLTRTQEERLEILLSP
jgi:hypothetical protein